MVVYFDSGWLVFFVFWVRFVEVSVRSFSTEKKKKKQPFPGTQASGSLKPGTLTWHSKNAEVGERVTGQLRPV